MVERKTTLKNCRGTTVFNKPVVGTIIVRNHLKHAQRIEMPREDYLTLIFTHAALIGGMSTILLINLIGTYGNSC
jgi:hypothetical protein